MLFWLLSLPLGKAERMGLKGLIAADIRLTIFYYISNAKDADETEKWEGDAADFVVASFSKELRNTVVFVVPESTPADSHAAHPTKTSGFTNEISESEINSIDYGVQVSKAR